MNKSFLLTILAVSYLSLAGGVNAATTNFPSCIAPTGNRIANYDNGTHGIPDVGSKIGKDAVYSQGEGNALQCFCGTDGTGIQTNWLNASDLTQDEIKVLQNEGWIYIPDGSAWGLSQGAYLAKNISYSCSSTTTNSGGGDGRTDGLTDGRSDGRGSIVQAASGSLASTGNLLFIAEIFGLGVLLSMVGLVMRSKSN